MAKNELLTLRDYAKKVGTTHQTVSKAIKDGKIINGFNEASQTVDPAVADLEWGFGFAQQRAIKQVGKPGAAEIGGEVMTDFTGEISNTAKSAELYRIKLYYEARKVQLAVQEAEGRLIDKDETYRQLFGWGLALKNELSSLPDRILDLLQSADRAEAKLIFDKEIHRVLEIMAGYDADFDQGNS